MNINVTILADNIAGRAELRGESGLSIFIESPSRNYLFDTGLGDLFHRNAELLGVEIFGADDIILSHGHYDHTNGLPVALEYCPRAHLILQRRAIEPKYSSSTGKLRYIGLDKHSLSAVKQADAEGRVSYLEKKPLHFPDAIIFSTGGRTNIPEDWNFYQSPPDGKSHFDRFEDEISLLIKGDNSAFLVVGCSHCSLQQIVEKAETLSDLPIRYILGGSHLNKVSNDEIKNTAEFFRQRPECKLLLGHCTGINGFARLYRALDGKNLEAFNTGWKTTLEI